ncbi:unnamed protein product [Sphagnum tenellum]
MITLPKTAAREEEEKRCKEKEHIIVVAQDNTGGPRVQKLGKKNSIEKTRRKKGSVRGGIPRTRALQASNPDRIKSRCKCKWERATERARKTHFVPVLQATDCTRQERRKTNERTDALGRRTKRNGSLIAIRRLKSGVHILSNDGSYGGELN